MKPKRSLGQNFLINPGVADKIIAFSGLINGETVLEIGPGKGALTKKLAEIAGRVVAVEKDDELSEMLDVQFKGSKGITVINADILETDMTGIVPKGSMLISNLPYNIATHLIGRLLEIPGHFKSITIMIQKEVGERVCALRGTKDYSALSIIVASCFESEPGFIVGPGNFSPMPKVDSIVMRLIPKHDAVSAEELETLKKVTFCAFGSRRKMLRNSLLNLPGLTAEKLKMIEIYSGISFTKRPQELDISEFKKLAALYHKASAG